MSADRSSSAGGLRSFSSRTNELTSMLNTPKASDLTEKHINADPRASKAVEGSGRCNISLTWRDLCYEAKVGKTKEQPAHIKKILKGVTGHVSSGQMLAILGPSGAGKTTMLDILACRQKGGTVSGELLMNGQEIDQRVFRRVSCYVQQEDILHGYLTVRETIRYAAKLRTPPEVTPEMIEAKCQRVMELLGIDHVAERKIGSEFVRGVSGGEKKRCAIAVELVTDPSLVYLDEPTTGLDTFTAMHLLYILKNLTRIGAAIVFSIHQPRSSIFRLFDSLLLLNGFGEEAYFGSAMEAVGFMDTVGVRCTEPDNPADFLLDSVSVVRAAENLSKDDFPFLPPPTQSQDIAAAFRSTQLAPITDEVEAIIRLYAHDSQLPEALDSPYYRPVWFQILVVSSRALLNKVRDPIATVVSIIVAMVFAVLVGSIYFQVPANQSGMQNRLGVLFFLTMNTAFSNLGALAAFLFDRSIYIREHRNGMYRPSAYYFGKILQDVPIAVVINFFFSVIAYFMVGLRNDFVHFLWFFLVSTLVMLNSFGMCMFVSNISKNYQIANVIAPLILVMYLIPSGLLIKLDSVPVIWRWIKYISFFRYGFEALVVNEFKDRTFSCDDADSRESINNSSSTDSLCIPSGNLYIQVQLDFDPNAFGSSTIICAVSASVYIILGYICLRLFRTNEGK